MQKPEGYAAYIQGLTLIMAEEFRVARSRGEIEDFGQVEDRFINAQVITRNLFSDLPEIEKQSIVGFCLAKWSYIMNSEVRPENANQRAEMQRHEASFDVHYCNFRPRVEEIAARDSLTPFQKYFLHSLLGPLFE